ncbi:hypothetical protein J6590_033465 [Homalodisca vitripennis]|nr:hypothetical protein J6590_033465 [Homalodisca vitripennis]
MERDVSKEKPLAGREPSGVGIARTHMSGREDRTETRPPLPPAPHSPPPTAITSRVAPVVPEDICLLFPAQPN